LEIKSILNIQAFFLDQVTRKTSMLNYIENQPGQRHILHVWCRGRCFFKPQVRQTSRRHR